jgi:hypothetical protein
MQNVTNSNDEDKKANRDAILTMLALLTERRQWVGWRKVQRNGKETKVPINPHTGLPARVNQPETWGTFDEAWAAAGGYGLDGVGFVFTSDDPFVGIDLDKCRDPETGQIEPWARAVIRTVNSYTELSQSRTGVHILVVGTLPPGARRKGPVEMYDRNRFFIMTGDCPTGMPRTIQTRHAELHEVHAHYLQGLPDEFAPALCPLNPQSLSDAALIERASSAHNGAKFSRLMEGLWEGEYHSQSEADAALCALLAFWTDEDGRRVDALFRQSKLMRAKWDERHYAGGQTYGEGTIARAISLSHKTYHRRTTTTHSNTRSRENADDLPSLNAKDQNLAVITAQAWSAIAQANNPPYLFLYAGLPHRLEPTALGGPILNELTPDRLLHEVARAANWFRGEASHLADAKPPMAVIRDMLATPTPPLPPLDRIVEVPVFGRDGRLLATPGYHENEALYYAPSAQLIIPPVPPVPTSADVQAARDLLLNEWLVDFPFANNSSTAHALACVLLPFVRNLIDGPTPLHVIEKPTPRTGATLLAQMIVLPAMGMASNHLQESRDSDEWHKLLTAELLRNPQAICFDNIRRCVDSGALASAITSTLWKGRRLGHSETLHLPVRNLWLMTANNPTFSNEILARSVFIRLDTHSDRPQDRHGFRHPLPRWAMVHRPELIHAVLILIQSWVTAGQPRGTRMKGGFESWAAVLGGILTHVGISDFLNEPEPILADPESDAWREFLIKWWELRPPHPHAVRDLFEFFFDTHNPQRCGDPPDLDLGEGGSRSQRIRLGKLLSAHRDQYVTVSEDYYLKLVAAGELKGAKLWQLLQIPRTANPSSLFTSPPSTDPYSETGEPSIDGGASQGQAGETTGG